jgi:trehalose 6-phosphate phosphatase
MQMPSPVRDPAELPAPPVPAPSATALFLDVDGTLLDFADAPDRVRVDASLLASLEGVSRRLGGAVALLSGRPLAELDALFDWHGRPAAGLHGSELRGPDGRTALAGDAAAFTGVRRRAAARVAQAHGVILEDKQRALALHYRRAPAALDAAERIATELLAHAGGGYVLQRGDHVVELKPAGVDKGGALAALLREAPFAGRTPWVLGDDLTDEDAFVEANRRGGIGIIVGARRPTAATRALRDPPATRTWLAGLAAV